MTRCASCGVEINNTEAEYQMRGNYCGRCSAIIDNLSKLRLIKNIKTSKNAKKIIELLKNRGLKEEEIMAKIGVKI